MCHEDEISKPTKWKGLTPALFFWLLWALLPMPMVWLGIYNFKAFWITILLYGGVVCILPIAFVRYRKTHAPGLSFAFDYSKSALIQIILLIGLTWLCMEGGWFLLKQSLVDWQTWPKPAGDIGIKLDVLFWLLLFYFIILNPIVEECFWRGIIYDRLKSGFSQRNAIIISSLLFGGWHWILIQYFFTPPWQIALTLLVCVGGVIFALLYEKSKSLVPGIIVHGLGADLAIMLILYDALYKP